jgi:1-pyrroline-5-carboxylate dehydrogenase
MLARSTRAAITASKEAGLQNCRGSSFFRCTTTRNANLNHAVSARQLSTTVPGWATLDPNALGVVSTPHYVGNIVGGTWQPEGIIKNTLTIPNPMDRDASALFTVADTSMDELAPFVKSMEAVSKSGVHNPLRNVERYLMYGDISRKAGAALLEPEVLEFFTQSIMKCVPKSHAQAQGEVKVTAAFLNNFGGDNVRFLARSFGVPGDHLGQQSNGYRWPFGPVAIVAPFNFPLEIPVLQLMGALFMGNKPVLKPAEKVALVMEQFIHLLHACGMPKEDVDMLNCQGPVAEELIVNGPIRLTQFTGSTRVAEHLSQRTHGKVKIEDAGFDWKILGPDVSDVDYVAWQCDQDAYASQGQKCSAQSIMFAHDNWEKAGLLEKIKANAAVRNLDDLTIGPVLTHTTADIMDHISTLLKIPGASVLFGGKELSNHKIPDVYGAVEPTAVFVPLKEMLKDEYFDTCVTEKFAPFQVVTTYGDDEVDLVLEACERMSHHLTAAVVSNDKEFQNKVLAHTVNGTTYAGIRARTTGAPQNHWFGPAGDTRGAGIGTPEAIKMVWSCHREIIHDGIVPKNWVQPKAT